MDMSRYASSSFIKVDDLADGPERKVIAEIGEGRFEKPVATFDDGTKLVAQRHQRRRADPRIRQERSRLDRSTDRALRRHASIQRQ